MIANVIQSIREEIESMTSGHFVPYHILSVLVSIIAAILFSAVFVHNTIYDGKIAVIDLDQSQTSTALIEKLDTSRYIEIASVTHNAVDPTSILMGDRYLGVLYIGPNFEKNIIRGDQSVNIGYFADSANMSQNSSISSNLQSIISAATAQSGGSSGGTVSVVMRNLFNVTGTYTNTIMAGFMFFFPTIYLGITVLMLMGRLHVTGLWQATMQRGLVALFARLIPYAFFYTATTTFCVGVLATFNDLRFVGNVWVFLPVVFLTAVGVGLCAMILTFNATTPASGSAFMIFVVPPGFILGGVTIATALLPEWCQIFSHIFPLTWLFAFYRDIALRGVGLTSVLGTYGAFILYLTALAAIVAIKYFRAQKVLMEHEKLLAEEA